MYPEFLPDPKMERRNKLKEKLERMDMLQRRSVIEIPEFYTGKLAITPVFFIKYFVHTCVSYSFRVHHGCDSGRFKFS